MSINQLDPLIPTTSWVRELYNDLNNRIVNSGGSQSLAQVLGVAADANSVPITGLVSLAAATTLDLKIGATTKAQITSAGLLVDDITNLSGELVIGTTGTNHLELITNGAATLFVSSGAGIQMLATTTIIQTATAEFEITAGTAFNILVGTNLTMNGQAAYTGTVAGAAGKSVVNGIIID